MRSKRQRAAVTDTDGGTGSRPPKRERLPNLYEVAQTNNIRTALALQAYAEAEAKQGRGALAEFCTRNGGKLEEIIRNAWRVAEAPQRFLQSQMTLVQKLAAAAQRLQCQCGGRWLPGCSMTARSRDRARI